MPGSREEMKKSFSYSLFAFPALLFLVAKTKNPGISAGVKNL